MITEFLIGLASLVGETLLGWIPDLGGAETLVVDASNVLGPILAGGASLGAWMPWGVLVATIGVVMGVYFTCLIFKVLLRLAGHLPQIGGHW